MMENQDDQTGEGRPLEITWEDLEQPDVSSRVQQMQQARQVPLVRTVGAPPPAEAGIGALLRGSFFALTVAGLLGGLLAFALVEIVAQPNSEDPWYGDGRHTGNIVFSLVIGLGVGLVIAAWDGVQARSMTKAFRSVGLASIALVLVGLLGGYLASLIYHEMTSSVIEDAFERASRLDDRDAAADAFYDYVSSHLHLPRGIAIGVVGLSIGVGLGLASLSVRRAINGAVGGVVGGFLGGFLFDYISSDGGRLARFIAVVLVGLLIGALTGLIEVARRDHWLEIVSGGMAGKQFILYHQSSQVGSAPEVAITLIKDPQIAPRHAVLQRQGAALNVIALDPSWQVLVNGQPVASHRLGDGDLLQFGSTVVRYRARESAAPVSSQIYG
jgi:hypothetical protein